MIDGSNSTLEWLTGLAKPKNKVRNVFQPETFDEYVGQTNVKQLLQIAIDAAKIENRDLPNIMLVGGFGLGKTSLAQIIIKEFGAKLTLIDGASVNKELPKGLVVIDEIHNLKPETCDSLNMQIDQGNVNIVGCTTNPGLLPSAFRSRFRILQLNNYSENELVEIASNICSRKGVTAEKPVLSLLAKRSRSNARQITTLLSNIFDVMAIQNSYNVMTQEIVLGTFQLLGVDQNGYLERDKAYVKALPDRPVGLKWLSSVLGIDPATIEEEIEPYLLQTGVIDRTPRGRVKIHDL